MDSAVPPPEDREFSPAARRWISLVFLSVAAGLCFVTYTKPSKYWLDGSLSLRPDVLSTLIAIVVILPLYSRQLLRWRMTPFCLAAFALNLFLASAFVQLIRGGSDDPSKVVDYLLFLTVILSWLGVRAVARWSMVALLALALYSVIEGGVVMGMYGYVLVACSFLGLVTQSARPPHELVQEFVRDFGGDVNLGPVGGGQLPGSTRIPSASQMETTSGVPVHTELDQIDGAK